MKETLVDLLVIGAGPAGLAVALAAAEAGVKRIVIMERLEEPGGILQQCIHNGFGLRYFKEELTGPEYAWRFIDRLAAYPQIRLKTGTMITELTSDKRITAVSAAEGLVYYRARAVVLAMGCRERPRGAINIPGTRPAGVYSAGTVQRLMNVEGLLPGKRAVILGSGDIGLIMARRLTLEGVKVEAVLELLPYSSGLTRNVVQCLHDFEIPLYLSHTVTQIFGEQRVSGIEAAPVDANRQPLFEQAFRINCDTLVLSVGLIPENELSSMAGVELDPLTGGPVVNADYQTNVPGIFGCGNVVHVHDLVDDVSEESQVTGRAVARYLQTGTALAASLAVRAGRNVRSVVPQSVALDRPTTLYIRAAFPERDRLLRVGSKRQPVRVVTPGETIHWTVRPEDLNCREPEFLTVSLEEGD